MTRSAYFVWFGLLTGIPAGAQPASFVTPSLGFVYDPNLQALRSIRGIPGASLIDEPVDPGFAITSAVLSPGQDFALAVPAGDDARLRLIRFDRGGIRVRLMGGSMSSPDRIVFSPVGSAVLLYQNSGHLQIVTGLPDRPVALDLDGSTLDASPGAMAVSDDGELFVLSGGNADAGPVRLLSSNGTSTPLALPGSTTAIAFRRNSHDLLAASGGDVYLVRNPESNPDYRLVYTGDRQTFNPVAIQFYWNGTRALIADSGGALSQVELDSGRHAVIACECRAASLEPLAQRNVFRLTPVGDSPTMIIDVSGAEARVWFLPLAKTSREARSSQ